MTIAFYINISIFVFVIALLLNVENAARKRERFDENSAIFTFMLSIVIGALWFASIPLGGIYLLILGFKKLANDYIAIKHRRRP